MIRFSRIRLQRAPMRCRAVARLLQSYLDGELADHRTLLVAEHLGSCLRCGTDAHALGWLKARLGELAAREDADQVARLLLFADALAQQGHGDYR